DDLEDQLRLEVLGALAGYAAAAEAVEVGEGRMRADGDAVLLRHPDRAAHHDRVAGMKAAGDIGRGDELQHRGVVADRIGAEALAHVAVQVDLLSHSASSRGIIFIIFSSLSGLLSQPRLRGLTGPQ